MPALDITAAQFGVAVSAYAFSAAASGILAAGFADRFDRKRLLLFFYVGFTLGTVLCALAPNYHVLLAGRIVTGLFGGVMWSVILAIITIFSRCIARPCNGVCADRVRCEPGTRDSGWSFLRQPLELACGFRRAGRAVAGRDDGRAGVDEAGERASLVATRQQCLPASDRDRRPAALHAGVPGDDLACDRADTC